MGYVSKKSEEVSRNEAESLLVAKSAKHIINDTVILVLKCKVLRHGEGVSTYEKICERASQWQRNPSRALELRGDPLGDSMGISRQAENSLRTMINPSPVHVSHLILSNESKELKENRGL